MPNPSLWGNYMDKKEKKLLKMMKDKYFNYLMGESINDYCVLEDVAHEVFGWSDKRVRLWERKWREEYHSIVD